MTAKVLDLQTQYEQGKAAMTIDVMNLLQQWTDEHILGTDKKYVPFLKSKGLR